MRQSTVRPRVLIQRWSTWVAWPVPLAWLAALFAVWCVLSTADVVSTTAVLHCGSSCGHEGNPLAATLWHRGGVVGLVIQKVVITAVLASAAWALYRPLRTPRLALWALIAVDILAALTVGNNAALLLTR